VLDIETASATVKELLDLALTKIGATLPDDIIEPTEYEAIVQTAVLNYRNGGVSQTDVLDYLIGELEAVIKE